MKNIIPGDNLEYSMFNNDSIREVDLKQNKHIDFETKKRKNKVFKYKEKSRKKNLSKEDHEMNQKASSMSMTSPMFELTENLKRPYNEPLNILQEADTFSNLANNEKKNKYEQSRKNNNKSKKK